MTYTNGAARNRFVITVAVALFVGTLAGVFYIGRLSSEIEQHIRARDVHENDSAKRQRIREEIGANMAPVLQRLQRIEADTREIRHKLEGSASIRFRRDREREDE